MAERTDEDVLGPALEEAGFESGIEEQKTGPIYKVVGSSKIPVSKHMGKMWQSRRDAVIARREQQGTTESWNEAIAYYKNDQSLNRDQTGGNASRNRRIAARLNNQFSETENIVFANTTSLVPAIYAKNPRAEFTTNKPGDEIAKKRATLVERLVNALGSRRTPPGFNIKPRAKRAVVAASLTNRAWIEIGYTTKEESSEEGMLELARLASQLEKAKSKKDIEDIEGKIQALEDSIDVLRPSGPFSRFRRAQDVLFDSTGEGNITDARWAMVTEFLPSAFLRAKFFKEQKGERPPASIFAPTHVMSLGGESSDVDDIVNNFSLFDKHEDDGHKFGFSNREAYNKAKFTKVWWVWDATTRRVYLFNDEDWSWPLWVWDDPYKLDEFFPFYSLEFYTDPEGGDSRGEVSYYLDQQDAINEINDEERRARAWVRRNVIYNKNLITGADVDKFLKGEQDSAVGVDLEPDADVSKMLFSIPPPSAQFAQLFNKDSKFAAIDRISSVKPILQGVQFKTNTTNRAIEQYESTAQGRLEEKIDAIEDLLGEVYWGVAQMCLQFMSIEQVSQVLGEDVSGTWVNMSPDEIRTTFSIRVIGGSSIKPTSKAKKEEAITVGQVLGQFADVAPESLIISLRMLEQAFDEITISEEDWEELRQSIEQKVSGEAGGSGEQLAQMIDSLPPEAKQALGQMIAQGVPLEQAVQSIIQAVQGAQPGGGGNGAAAEQAPPVQ